jgi:hypothetical protein
MTIFNAEAFDAILQQTGELKDYIDTPYITASESFDTEEELREYLQGRIGEAEIIYYTNAMRFLLEYDPSLDESFELAKEYGYTLDKLNSEILATLLLQQKLSEELSELDLSDCFTESEEDAA